MLQAMKHGHDGSLTTVHAKHAARRADPYRNDDRDGRDEPAGARDAADLVGDPAGRAADALSDGSRKITSISEITGMEGDGSRCRRSSSSKRWASRRTAR
jgi:pilus assembly protein CpaF